MDARELGEALFSLLNYDVASSDADLVSRLDFFSLLI